MKRDPYGDGVKRPSRPAPKASARKMPKRPSTKVGDLQRVPAVRKRVPKQEWPSGRVSASPMPPKRQKPAGVRSGRSVRMPKGKVKK